MSPFKVLYGRDPPHLLRLGKGQTLVNSLDEFLQERDVILDELHFNLIKAQQFMKRGLMLSVGTIHSRSMIWSI